VLGVNLKDLMHGGCTVTVQGLLAKKDTRCP
jgi:hypothetical protein